MIKFNKYKWELVQLDNLCEINIGKTPSRNNLLNFGKGYTWISISDFTGEKILKKSKEEITDIALKQANHKIVEKDTLLLTFKLTLGKLAIAGKSLYTNEAIASLPIKDKRRVLNEYLYIVLQTIDYYSKSDKAVKGATLNKKKLGEILIPLPPLEEQKQIASLFQSIETAIEQVEEQEKCLKSLWKNLINDFVNEKPKMGDILLNKTLQKVKFCEVAHKLMRKIEPISYGIEKIVAGENMGTEDFTIRSCGLVGKDFMGPAFHVLFKPGDILYGSRRTYLKKVSVANFEGVCSNTTYVIRANEKLLIQDLLKHIMISDKFTNYSVGVSKGSTNPYINWKDLDNFSFYIPNLETQKQIVELLDKILNIIEQLKKQAIALKNLKQNLLNEILG